MDTMQQLYAQAQTYFPGGVSAGGRRHAVYGQPLFIDHADGCRLYDVNGGEYIDYHMSAGAAFFGYNHPRLRAAVQKALDKGFFMNYETQYHVELASLLCQRFPSAELVRFSNTGTEATMGAVRLARGYTGRDIVLRFEGHFHGMNELVWYNHNQQGRMDAAGEIESLPDTAGIPAAWAQSVKNVAFNDYDALERVVKRYAGRIAAIILEPISFNCGCYPARKAYLENVRALCDREGIVLIFDEVICGLRMRPGSAQAYYGVTPDITTLGKAIGGGFPMAAVVGKREIMQKLNPVGPVCMSGTYTGALMPVLASIECLKMAGEPGFYDEIDARADALYGGMNALFQKHGLPGHVRGVGARFGIYFGIEDPETDYDWRKVKEGFDAQISKVFLKKAVQHGLHFHDYGTSPVPAHYGFSTQHAMRDIEITLDKLDHIFAALKR